MSVELQDYLPQQEEPQFSFLKNLYQWMSPWWLPLVILVTMMGIATSSIYRARWLYESDTLSALITFGAIFGILLSFSRFSGWIVACYSFVLSILASAQAIGRVFPPLNLIGVMPSEELILGMNIRVFTLIDRLNGWVEVLVGGKNVEDTGLFVMLIGIVSWAASTWMAWNVLRRKRALVGILPYGFLLAVNVHLSQQDLNSLWVFFFLALLLVAENAYSETHQDWDRRRVDYPWDLNEWPASAVFIAIVIALIVRLSPVVGTPEGWRKISELVNKTRQQTAETANRLFSNVNPPKVEGPEVIIAKGPNLQEIGTPISQSLQTVLWVKVSDPPPPAPEPRYTGPPQNWIHHYYRNLILARYNGRGWDPPELQDVPLKPVPDTDEIPPGRYILEQEYTLEGIHGNLLYGVSQPVHSSAGIIIKYIYPDDSVMLMADTTYYTVISLATKVTANQLRESLTDYPSDIRLTYLQLPEELPVRVQNLAQRIVSGASNPYDKVLRIQNYLRVNYPYRLDVPPPPSGRDAVDYFLFDAQAGFCSYYATAMAVMTRVIGVPARVVTGFASGTYDYERGAYRVPASSAHAWVEVYFPPYGWIEFEPTAAYQTFEYKEEPEVSQNGLVSRELLDNQSSKRGWIAIVMVSLLFLLSILVLTGRLRWPFWPFVKPISDTRTQTALLYRQVRRALSQAGYGAPPSMTPDEYFGQFASNLGRKSILFEVLRQATFLYSQAIFSPRPPHLGDISITRSLWRQAQLEWLVLWFRKRVLKIDSKR